MVGDTPTSVNTKNPEGFSSGDRGELPQYVYETLREVRDASTRDLNARLSEAGFGDLTGNDLPILVTKSFGCALEGLSQWPGITRQAASQSIEALILHGYLKFPDDSRQSEVVLTERGIAAFTRVREILCADLWSQLPFRSGDIVISTAIKSGTTWMQMICALLIFQTPRLPGRLQELSPWPEERPGLRSEIYATLAAQQHRRFIKTHLFLNQLPDDPRVTYIVVARSPLDIAVSRYHQKETSRDRQSPVTARQWLLDQIDEMGEPGSYFDDILKRLSCAWERRNEPNTVLVHYEDLSDDLSGEMRRLAERLDIAVPEDKWPRLVEAATFKEMQAAADQLQPVRRLREQGLSERFFRRGSSGEGRALITEAEAARYRARAAKIAPQELLAWLYREDNPFK